MEKDKNGHTVSSKPVLESELPATYCSITYSAKANHQFLFLLGLSRVWVALPVGTLVFSMILVTVVSASLNKKFQMYDNQLYEMKEGQVCTDIANTACRVGVSALFFCLISVFTYYVVSVSMDLYAHTPMETAEFVIIGEYVLWGLTSLIYLWSIPTTRTVIFQAKRAFRNHRDKRFSSSDPTFNRKVKDKQRHRRNVQDELLPFVEDVADGVEIGDIEFGDLTEQIQTELHDAPSEDEEECSDPHHVD